MWIYCLVFLGQSECTGQSPASYLTTNEPSLLKSRVKLSRSQSSQSQVKSNITSADLNVCGNCRNTDRSQVSWFLPDIFSCNKPLDSFGPLALGIQGQGRSAYIWASYNILFLLSSSVKCILDAHIWLRKEAERAMNRRKGCLTFFCDSSLTFV